MTERDDEPTTWSTPAVIGGRGGLPRHSPPVKAPLTVVTVPAQLRFIEIVRRSAAIALEGAGGDAGCARDVALAVDELASIVILSAATPSHLRLTVCHDEAHAYVRMEAPLSADGFHPQVAELTQLLLDATVDVYDVSTNGRELVGTLQRRLCSGPSG